MTGLDTAAVCEMHLYLTRLFVSSSREYFWSTERSNLGIKSTLKM